MDHEDAESYQRNEELFARAVRDSQRRVQLDFGLADAAHDVARYPALAGQASLARPFPLPLPSSGSGPSRPAPSSPQPAFVPTVRARVVLMGFRCLRQTWDHALEVDGSGDEIFMTATVVRADTTGQELEPKRQCRSLVYGQRRHVLGPGRPDRGTSSAHPYAGIANGDFAPFPHGPFDMAQPLHAPSGNARRPLPIVIWEWVGRADRLRGILTVVPGVWEWDNDKELDWTWGDDEIASARAIAAGIATVATAGTALLPFLAIVGSVAGSLATFLPTVWRVGKDIVGEAGDRPIGQTRADDGSRSYSPPVLVIDLSHAATAAARNVGFGPGVQNFPVRDSANIGGGHYEAFVAFRYDVIA